MYYVVKWIIVIGISILIYRIVYKWLDRSEWLKSQFADDSCN